MSNDGMLVFRETVRRDRIVALAEGLAWTPTANVQRGHFVLASERFSTTDGTTVEYLEDHTADVRFAQVSGPSQSPVLGILRKAMPVYEEDALLDEVSTAQEPLAWIRGLSRLSVYRPETTHARYLSLWSRALNHESPVVRRAAIRTTYGCAWPEMLPLVHGRIALDRELRRPLESLARHLASLVPRR